MLLNCEDKTDCDARDDGCDQIKEEHPGSDCSSISTVAYKFSCGENLRNHGDLWTAKRSQQVLSCNPCSTPPSILASHEGV